MPGAPLEIRWSLKAGDNWAITAAALTSKLWLVKEEPRASGRPRRSRTIGDPAKIPLPVDISITRDGKGLWVNTFMDGTTRYFDLSNPEAPKQTYEKVTGKQVNMISQSWDGKRVYITSSLLANWDKGGSRQRAVPARLRLGRQGAEADVRGGLHQGEARPRPPHEARRQGAAEVVVRRARRRRRWLRVARRRRPPPSRHDGAPLPALDFEPPAPGTYTLHRIMAAPDGEVARASTAAPSGCRDSRASASRCSGSSTRPASIPTAARSPPACSTRSGSAVGATPGLRGKVRLVSLSFDPERDTPAAMRAYAGRRAAEGGAAVPWNFLTTRSAQALRPLVDGFGQDVRTAIDASAGGRGASCRTSSRSSSSIAPGSCGRSTPPRSSTRAPS